MPVHGVNKWDAGFLFSVVATVEAMFAGQAAFRPVDDELLRLSLALRDTPAGSRLIDTGGLTKKDRLTHRMAVSSLTEIDGELRRWPQAAYRMDK